MNPLSEQYSLSTIKTILEACEFEADGFDIYFKTFPDGSEFNLLKETIEYFLLKQEQGKNRRIAFIFEHDQGCYALLFQTLQFNIPLAHGLMNIIQSNQAFTTVDGILSSPYWNNFLFLYARIAVHALFQAGQEHVIQTIFNALPNFYPQASITTSLQLLGNEPSIELTEHLINMLTRGNIYEVKNEIAVEKHRRFCIQSLEHYLTRLYSVELGDYLSLMETLRILVKYTLLIQQRQLFLLPVEDARVKEILDADKMFKRLIFAMPFNNVRELCPYLSLNGITQILNLRHDFPSLLQALHSQKIMQYHTILDWEKTLEQQAQHYIPSWSTWGAQKATFVGQYIYERSFINLGANLSEWIALLLLPERISSIAKKIGFGLGTLYTYSAGIVGTLPMLGLIFIAEQTRIRFTTEYIDTAQARVLSNEHTLPSMSILMRTGDLFINAMIAWTTSTPEPLVRSMSAASMSLVFTRITDKMLLDLSQEITITEKDKAYIRFLVTTLGMQCGNELFNLYTHMAKKIEARDQARTVINTEMQAAGFSHQVEFPNLLLSPTLWFSESNPMTLSWSTSKSSYQASCNIMRTERMIECTTLRPPQSLIVGKL